MNGQLVFADKNLYQPTEARKKPDRCRSLENGLRMPPLRAADIELAVAIVNDFYGWGVKLHFGDVKDLLLVRQ